MAAKCKIFVNIMNINEFLQHARGMGLCSACQESVYSLRFLLAYFGSRGKGVLLLQVMLAGSFLVASRAMWMSSGLE